MAPLALHIPRLETERLILRAPTEADVDQDAAFYATEAARFVGGPKRRDETWRTVAMLLGHWVMRGYGFWSLEDKITGAYLGRTGLWFPEAWPEPEIGWTLMPHATGRGYATEAAQAARAHAYDILGWSTAISLIDPANTASQAVARRLGAQPERDYDHPAFGRVTIWRHLAPDALADGGPEAYA